jgi:hypothetical protein
MDRQTEQSGPSDAWVEHNQRKRITELEAERDKLKAMRPVDHRPLIGMIDRLEAENTAWREAAQVVVDNIVCPVSSIRKLETLLGERP